MPEKNRWHPCLLPGDYFRRIRRSRKQVQKLCDRTRYEPLEDDEPDCQATERSDTRNQNADRTRLTQRRARVSSSRVELLALCRGLPRQSIGRV